MGRKKVSLLINPRTGGNVAKLPDILAVLSAAGWKTDITLKEYGTHVMKLAHAASEQKQDMVIAYGGDGTLNQVVNGVMSAKGRRSVVGIMPGGTANVWAGEIGVPNDPVKAALTLVDSQPRRVDVGRIAVHSLRFPGEDSTPVHGKIKQKATQDSQRVRHHFLLMAGLGIDAAIMGAVSKPLKYRVGALAVGLSAAKELPEQRSFPLEIQAAGSDTATQPLWKGEALQVVIGNTRRYAKVAKMTPNAYMDDGVLDVCVITAGDPLSRVQQLSSLLLRLKPDNTTAEYFQGARLLITVPAIVPFQVDGSPVKLKDYLNATDYAKLQQAEDLGQVMVTYQFDAVPHALEVAVPCTYNEELFEHTAGRQSADGEHHSPVAVVPPDRASDEEAETPLQRHTEAVESQPQTLLNSHKEDDAQAVQHAEEMRKDLPDFVHALVEDGQKFTVAGKAVNPAEQQTYILAGHLHKQTTGEMVPAAIVVNQKTTVFNRDGQQVSDVAAAIREMPEGAVLVVEGKRNKRNALRARRLVL